MWCFKLYVRDWVCRGHSYTRDVLYITISWLSSEGVVRCEWPVNERRLVCNISLCFYSCDSSSYMYGFWRGEYAKAIHTLREALYTLMPWLEQCGCGTVWMTSLKERRSVYNHVFCFYLYDGSNHTETLMYIIILWLSFVGVGQCEWHRWGRDVLYIITCSVSTHVMFQVICMGGDENMLKSLIC